MLEVRERIFISSTINSLTDLRAEVAAHLSDLGMEPILSERPEFLTAVDTSTIELCLRRIEDSDFVFVIVDAQYGEPLPEHGEISATQLEYQHALKTSKPTFVFIRDRVMAVKASWVAADHRVADYPPVAASDADKVFGWIDAMENEKRWISLFQNSIDLKRRMSNILTREASRAAVRSGINDGSIPILHVTCDCGQRTPGQHLVYRVSVLNTGDKLLLDLVVDLVGVGKAEARIIPASSDRTQLNIKIPWKGNQSTYEGRITKANVEFTNLRGQRILQIFDTQIDTGSHSTILEKVCLVSHQTFTIG